MRTVILASLRVNTRRYVAAALAVVVGVSFVVTTAALTAATRDGLTQGVSAPYAGADVVATGLSGDDAARAVAAADGSGAEASVLGWATERVRRDGRVLGEVDEVGHLASGDLRWQVLTDGAFPTGAGEAVVDDDVADRERVSVGDRLEVGTVEVRVAASSTPPRWPSGPTSTSPGPTSPPSPTRCTSTAWPGQAPPARSPRPRPTRSSRPPTTTSPTWRPRSTGAST
jgi:putative ABC transport system permease protein